MKQSKTSLDLSIGFENPHSISTIEEQPSSIHASFISGPSFGKEK